MEDHSGYCAENWLGEENNLAGKPEIWAVKPSWRKRWDCSDCWPQGKELDLGGVLDVRQIRPADGPHMRGEEKRGIKDE